MSRSVFHISSNYSKYKLVTGSIRLRDNNPLSHPLIYANYFTHPDDVKVMVEGIKIGLKLAGTKGLYLFQLYGYYLVRDNSKVSMELPQREIPHFNNFSGPLK